MAKFPRRKVTDAYISSVSGGTEYYRCTLACGHSVIAYGAAKHGDAFGKKHPPKTCECRECATTKDSP